MATTPTMNGVTYNTDVLGLVRRMNRFIEELTQSQSANVTKTMAFDATRFHSYINAMREYMAWSQSMPELDLPETAPRSTPLPANPVIPPMENESVYDLAVLFELARDEISNSQSSRLASNLVSFDAARITAVLDKAEGLIDFMTGVDPLDLPESSPRAPVTGAGRGGV